MIDPARLLNNARATAEAAVAMFGPRVEVVVHDLRSETIAHITNPTSNRRPGDPSNMHEIDLRTDQDVIGPYEKVKANGSVIRSISVVMRDADDVAQLVLCINHDQTDVQQLQAIVGTFALPKPTAAQPSVLFRNDWHETLNRFVADWCGRHRVDADALDRKTRRKLVAAVAGSGGLGERHAASYIARVLGVSRATIYNDLKSEGVCAPQISFGSGAQLPSKR